MSNSGSAVRVEVWDPSPAPPVPAGQVPADAEAGRGLQMVSVLSGGRWGSTPYPSGGKVTWAEIELSGERCA